MKSLLIIGGATGSGKSDIAVACAKLLNGEVVSADSMQIYRGLDIGTAKITLAETQGVPHHMIDVVDPMDAFTAAEYKETALRVIRDIDERGKTPIFCGGTGLYIHSILYDLSFSGEYDPELRASLLEELRVKGRISMHEKLAELDPEAADRLHVNDEKRVLRAIEKALTGGQKESDRIPKYPYKMFVTDMPRELLYARINRRVDRMISAGLKEEVFRLLNEGVGYDKQCIQAIAYKEWSLGEKGASEEEIVRIIKKNTRNYAKRQITWFKQYKDAIRIDVTKGSPNEIAKEIARVYNGERE